MKIINIVSMEIKGLKNKFIVLFIILTLGMTMFIVISSMKNQVLDYLNKGIYKTPFARSLICDDIDRKEMLLEEPEIEDVVSLFQDYDIYINSSLDKLNDKSNIYMDIYSKAYKNYIIKGREIEKADEIIIPSYIGNDNKYYDISELYGEKIKLTSKVINFYTGEVVDTKTYTFKVVGVVDNFASGLDFLIDEETGKKINDERIYVPENITEEEKYKIMEEQAEQIGVPVEYLGTPEEYFGNNIKIKKYLVICNSYDDMIKVMNKYNYDPYMSTDSGYIKEIDMIFFILNGISTIIIIIAIINIIINIINTISKRRWEFALKCAMGYTKKLQSGIIMMEYSTIIIFSLITSSIISKLIMKAFKNILQEKIVILRVIEFNPSMRVLAFTVIIAVISMIISYLIAYNRICNIDMAKELKKDE